jgi:hypothetical protein
MEEIRNLEIWRAGKAVRYVLIISSPLENDRGTNSSCL